VKKLDETAQHFTYVMLLTARDDFEAMERAFDVGVDDFLNKANLRAQLLPRVVAAKRMATRQNELIRANRLLRKKLKELQTTDLVDPVTGLGNLKFTLERIGDATRQVEARGGAACLLLVGISNLKVIREQYDATVVDELMSGMGAKLRQLVRPLDLVTRPESSMFAVITHHPAWTCARRPVSAASSTTCTCTPSRPAKATFPSSSAYRSRRRMPAPACRRRRSSCSMPIRA
jgi:phosphoserine phosphatase RsbU/P